MPLRTPLRSAAGWWAVGGVALIFADAIVQLGRRGVTTIARGLDPSGWIILIVLTAAFAYGEGIRALARRWVPMVVRRAGRLDADSPLRYRLLAPLHAMALIGAPARDVLRAWLGVGLIVAAVLVVRALPEPWRGIIDFAVAVALAIGLLALIRRTRGPRSGPDRDPPG